MKEIVSCLISNSRTTLQNSRQLFRFDADPLGSFCNGFRIEFNGLGCAQFENKMPAQAIGLIMD